MKTIKLKYVDFWPEVNPDNYFFTEVLRKKFNVIISEEPDYIFYGPFGNENLKYMDCIRIFYTGECVVPDFNFCDYAIGFDRITFPDRYFRLPLFYLYDSNMLNQMMNKHIIDGNFQNRDKFCGFVVSNVNGKFRNECFELLSMYKKVDSGGRYMNNIDLPEGVADKEAFDREHKFSLCFENQSYPGYLSEKLPQAFAHGCIPIYWGDPTVGETFNEKAFINVNSYSSFQQAMEKIKYIDANNDEYLKMLSEPAIVDEKYYPEIVLGEFEAFLFSIFDQPLNQCRRRTHSNFASCKLEIYNMGIIAKEKDSHSIKNYIRRMYRFLIRKLKTIQSVR